MNEASFTTQFERDGRVNDLQRDDLDVLCEQAVNGQVEDKPYRKGIDGNELIPGNESKNESSYGRTGHNDVRLFES